MTCSIKDILKSNNIDPNSGFAKAVTIEFNSSDPTVNSAGKAVLLNTMLTETLLSRNNVLQTIYTNKQDEELTVPAKYQLKATDKTVTESISPIPIISKRNAAAAILSNTVSVGTTFGGEGGSRLSDFVSATSNKLNALMDKGQTLSQFVESAAYEAWLTTANEADLAAFKSILKLSSNLDARINGTPGKPPLLDFMAKDKTRRIKLRGEPFVKNGEQVKFYGMLEYLSQDVLGSNPSDVGNPKVTINQLVLDAVAVSMYQWLSIDGIDSMFNDDTTINKIIGKQDKNLIDEEYQATFQKVGTVRAVVNLQIGKAITASLGFEKLKNVDGAFMTRLQVGLGQLAVGFMIDEKILIQTPVKASEFPKQQNYEIETLSSEKTPTSQDTLFVAVSSETEMLKGVMALRDDRRDTNALDELFDIESGKTYPSSKPSNKTPKTYKRTSQSIPQSTRTVMQNKQNDAWGVKEKVAAKFFSTSEKFINAVIGIVDVDKKHITQQRSFKAINESKLRTLAVFKKFREGLSTPNDKFYMKHFLSKSARMFIANNSINPVTQKMIRTFIGLKHHTMTVKVDDPATRLNFDLAIGELFGVNISGQAPKISLAQIAQIKIDTADAVKLIQKDNLSRPEEDIILKAIGKNGLGGFEGLLALADYRAAESFETTLTIEHDAKTSGIALGLLQASTDPDKLPAVGVFTDGVNKSYGEWHSQLGNYDLYEQLTIKWAEYIKPKRQSRSAKEEKAFSLLDPEEKKVENERDKAELKVLKVKVAGVQSILGDFVSKEISEVMRTYSKDPLMQTSYGSALETAKAEFRKIVLKEWYTNFATKTKGKQPALKQLKLLELLTNTTIENKEDIDPITFKLSKGQTLAFEATVDQTHGKALTKALNEQLSGVTEFNYNVNKAMQALFVMFSVKFKQMLKAKQEEIGDRTISIEETNEVFESIRAFMPIIKGPMAKSLDEGITLLKSKIKRNNGVVNGKLDNRYKVQTQFSEPLTGTDSKSNTSFGEEQVYEGPGVGGMVNIIHNIDAAILEITEASYTTIGYFDATISRLDEANAVAQTINKAFLDVSMSHSIMAETLNSFQRIAVELNKDPDQTLWKEAVTLMNETIFKREILAKNGNGQRVKENAALFIGNYKLLLKTVQQNRISFLEDNPDIAVNNYAGAEPTVHVHESATAATLSEADAIDLLFEDALTFSNTDKGPDQPKPLNERVFNENESPKLDADGFVILPRKKPKEKVNVTYTEKSKKQNKQKSRNNKKGSSDRTIDFDNFHSTFEGTITASTVQTIFNHLEHMGSDAVDTPSHKAKLKEVLDNVVQVQEAIDIKVGETDTETFGALRTFTDGKLDITIQASTNMIRNRSGMTAQNVYVHELVHAVTQFAIDTDFAARKVLKKLYKQAQKNTTWEDFLATDVASATDSEIRLAKENYNYIFNNNKGLNGKATNDYLHEFVAFGLTHNTFSKKLESIKVRDDVTIEDSSLWERISAWFDRVVNLLLDRLDKTSGLSLDKALRQVVNDITNTHEKKRINIFKAFDLVHVANPYALAAIKKVVLEPLTKYRKYTEANPPSKFNVPRRALYLLSNITALADDNIRANVSTMVGQISRNLGITERSMLTKLVREVAGLTEENWRFHVLLRKSKKIVDQLRTQVSATIQEQLVRAMDRKPTKLQSEALYKVFLESDLSVLLDTAQKDKYTVESLIQLLKDSDFLKEKKDEVIAELNSAEFGNNSDYYIKQGTGLGNLNTTGEDATLGQMRNAHIIATLANRKDQKQQGDITRAEKLIDELATLQSLFLLTAETKLAAAEVVEHEHSVNPKTNGITTLLDLQVNHKKDSLERLFNGNKMQTRKGYVAEVFNSDIDVKVSLLQSTRINEDTGKSEIVNLKLELEREGYVMMSNPLAKDKLDPTPGQRFMFVNTNKHTASWVKSIMSLTAKQSQGFSIEDMHNATNLDIAYKDAKQSVKQIHEDMDKEIAKQFEGKSTKFKSSTLIPLVNDKGETVSYRYMMTSEFKEDTLERNNAYDAAIGRMYASIEDKVNSTQINLEAMQLAKKDYDDNYLSDPSKFVDVVENSADKEIAEMYALMPDELKGELETIWGKGKPVKIRKEYLNLMFGFRKLRAKDAKNVVGTAVRGVNSSIDYVLRNSFFPAAPNTDIGKLWTEVIDMVKDLVVVRTGVILIPNFMSNNYVQFVKGIPIKQIGIYQKEALEALDAYQKELLERDIAVSELKINLTLSKNKRAKLEAKVARLNTELQVNPVGPLIDEGVFGSIIEDINFEEDIYSSKAKLSNKAGELADKYLPDYVKPIYKHLYLTKDTTPYKVLLKVTQVSDFMARYSLYRHRMGNMPKLNKDATASYVQDVMNEIVQTFVNYDLPTSAEMQYINDVGLFPFSKFYFRIQKVIFSLFKNRPASQLSLHVLEKAVGEQVSIDDGILTIPGTFGRLKTPLDHVDTITDVPLLAAASSLTTI